MDPTSGDYDVPEIDDGGTLRLEILSPHIRPRFVVDHIVPTWLLCNAALELNLRLNANAERISVEDQTFAQSFVHSMLNALDFGQVCSFRLTL